MNQSDTPGRIRLTNTLHITMITLCVIACIYMFFIPSITTKLILSIIIIAYSYTIISRSSSIRNLLKIAISAQEQNYKTIHKWNIEKEKVDLPKNHNNNKNFDNSSMHQQKKSAEQSFMNNSFERSLDKSMDIKNISMSLQRSVNFNNLNQTRLSRLSQREIKEFKGADISEIFATDESYKSDSILRKTKGSNITLVDNQTYVNHNTSKYFEQANKEYEKILKTVLKIQKKSLDKKYKSIMQMIRTAVKVLVVDHNAIRDRLIKVAEECFDVKIVENKSSLRQQMSYIPLRHSQTKRISFYYFLYHMLLVYTNKIEVAQLQMKFKNGYSWIQVYIKITELIQGIIKLSGLMGVDTSNIESQLRINAQAFVEDYRSYVELAQLYLDNESYQIHNSQSKGTTFQSQLMKARAFALYLIVKEINSTLKYAGKIKFNDYFGFRYPKNDKLQFQIYKKEGTEGPCVHYDLKVYSQDQQKMKYYSQPGDRNYLSVLYFLFLQFSKKEELLSWNTYIRGMVKQFV